ncbi:MAG: hypothetical protein J7L12_03090 [Desulfurococcales archaeon]|nr:hypothetical protein [Desulfurococcales archaeon]
MNVKNETRVLFIYSVKTGKINLSLYAVIRGDKGLEHLGIVSGGISRVVENARERGILDEVRYIVDLDNTTSIRMHASNIRQEWISDILKILTVLEKEIVRLIGT